MKRTYSMLLLCSIALGLYAQTSLIKSGEFEQNLYYNTGFPAFTEPLIAPQFSGNIALNTWTYNEDINGYFYYYDLLNRLTQAYTVKNNGIPFDPYSENFTYDKHGNITRLDRAEDEYIDGLAMTYNGNQLKKVTNWVDWYVPSYNQKHYQDLVDLPVEFDYDKNGNMIKDLDRNIVTIQYNLLNLPSVIQFKNGNQIRNIYAADGRKLETEYRTVPHNAITPITVGVGDVAELNNSNSWLNGTIYAGNKEYKYGGIRYITEEPERIHNPEGYISFNPMNGADMQAGWSSDWYNYYRKDHLGNVREVWRAPYYHTSLIDYDENWNPVWGQFTIAGETVQRTQYYPSGLPWAEGLNRGEQPYLHNSTEFIEMHGYDVSDHGNRGLYNAINRYTTIDRFAEKFPWQSPYVHAGNNPIRFVDARGDSIMVAEQYREQYNSTLTDVFGRHAENFGYTSTGMLTFSGSTRGMTRRQRAVFRELSVVMNETTTTNIIFGESTQITFTDGSIHTLSAPIDRGGVAVLVSDGQVSENTILVNPATTQISIIPVTAEHFKPLHERTPGARVIEDPMTIQTNVTDLTFHEKGHVRFQGQPQHNVLNFNNRVRRIIGLPTIRAHTGHTKLDR
jgi:hypothetical protein